MKQTNLKIQKTKNIINIFIQVPLKIGPLYSQQAENNCPLIGEDGNKPLFELLTFTYLFTSTIKLH